MAGSSKTKSKGTPESIQTIPFSGSETTKDGVMSRKFFDEIRSLSSCKRFQEGDDGRQSQGRVCGQREVDRR